MICRGLSRPEKYTKTYLSTRSKIVRNPLGTFRRKVPCYIGNTIHSNPKGNLFSPLLECDGSPCSCQMTSSDQNNILAAYSQATFLGERKPLIDVFNHAFSEVPPGCRV